MRSTLGLSNIEILQLYKNQDLITEKPGPTHSTI